MSDLVKIARERIDGTQATHWVGCERDHRECLIQRMADEIEHLRAALKRANDQAEHFEREWYLRGDENEKLRAERDELKLAVDAARILLAERDALKAENEILALDEIRFNWLAARLEDVQIDDVDPNDHYYVDEEDVWYPVLWRRAIDAARGKE